MCCATRGPGIGRRPAGGRRWGRPLRPRRRGRGEGPASRPPPKAALQRRRPALVGAATPGPPTSHASEPTQTQSISQSDHPRRKARRCKSANHKLTCGDHEDAHGLAALRRLPRVCQHRVGRHHHGRHDGALQRAQRDQRCGGRKGGVVRRAHGQPRAPRARGGDRGARPGPAEVRAARAGVRSRGRGRGGARRAGGPPPRRT